MNGKTFRLGIRPIEALGFTDAEHNTIYMAIASQFDELTVKHEMAHQLDYWSGVDEGEDYHPQDVFENCGLHTHG